ncbi:hypothetical protein VC83_06553 [Pseudogymnoascus destructans]|uniref:Uncharacterized protein n=1 Tax=Pseudogymnoascus destructans TaxID=655981 RepID=A0A177A7Q7_9PEZI|nr:uncharacterized protein VC83_06553 [Pseudogymnoascus destructans]OAF58195.1 hypothetical protein VC83_06553 [Pseudogymnoascus destructans]
MAAWPAYVLKTEEIATTNPHPFIPLNWCKRQTREPNHGKPKILAATPDHVAEATTI